MNKSKRSCLTCTNKDTCLERNVAIFQLFITSGREEEIKKANESVDIGIHCGHWRSSRQKL